ncbi:MAG: SUMF1/EgtB/PvdO family nonheme iron enzyme [Gemmatimonadetes bacterium]|nr:SUMF1/EgtB/PvdO family nonheme iron enzyme [Gemmatimonadota bacterium]
MTPNRSMRVGLLALCATFGSCDADRRPDGTATRTSDSTGVLTARGPDADVELSWPMEVVWELPPELGLFRIYPHHVAPFSEGRLAILDDPGRRVVVVDLGGSDVLVHGRPGGGPGELEAPTAIAAREDTLFVMDVGRGGLLTWVGGEEVAIDRLGGFWGPDVRRGATGTMYVRRPGGARRQELVLRDGATTRTLGGLEGPRESPGGTEKCGLGRFPVPALFALDLTWDVRGRTVASIETPEYRVRVGSVDGRLDRVLTRPAVTPTASRALVAAEMSGESITLPLINGNCTLSVEDVIEWRGFAEVVPPIRRVTVMPSGEIWITRRGDLVRTHRVDVWSASGIYVGTLVVSGGVPIAGLPTGEVVVLGRDDLTGPVLRVLEVDRGASAPPHLTDVQPGGLEPGRGRAEPPRVVSARDPTDTRVPIAVRPLGDSEFRDCEGCPVMVRLPGGAFDMGAPAGEAPARDDPTRPDWTERAEQPVRSVEIAPFAIGKYEVTFDEWSGCYDAGVCAHDPHDEGFGRGDQPLFNVSRPDALEFVAWLSEVTGESYRLPSEAEWEYAARGGTTAGRWWGDGAPDGRAACDGCGSAWDNRSPAPAGSFPPNPFALHDMLSNVSEWVADCWHEDHADASRDGAPRVETSPWWSDGVCARPVRRGGAWSFLLWTTRAAHRAYWADGPWLPRRGRDQRSWTVGFRVARDLSRDAS